MTTWEFALGWLAALFSGFFATYQFSRYRRGERRDARKHQEFLDRRVCEQADRQDKFLKADDPRGIYGDYLPTDLVTLKPIPLPEHPIDEFPEGVDHENIVWVNHTYCFDKTTSKVYKKLEGHVSVSTCTGIMVDVEQETLFFPVNGRNDHARVLQSGMAEPAILVNPPSGRISFTEEKRRINFEAEDMPTPPVACDSCGRPHYGLVQGQGLPLDVKVCQECYTRYVAAKKSTVACTGKPDCAAPMHVWERHTLLHVEKPECAVCGAEDAPRTICDEPMCQDCRDIFMSRPHGMNARQALGLMKSDRDGSWVHGQVRQLQAKRGKDRAKLVNCLICEDKTFAIWAMLGNHVCAECWNAWKDLPDENVFWVVDRALMRRSITQTELTLEVIENLKDERAAQQMERMAEKMTRDAHNLIAIESIPKPDVGDGYTNEEKDHLREFRNHLLSLNPPII